MQFTSSILPAVVAFTIGASAWTQGGDGVWRANINYYQLDGSKWPYMSNPWLYSTLKINFLSVSNLHSSLLSVRS